MSEPVTVPAAPVASVIAKPLKAANLRQTWDDDCEQIMILHPVGAGQHVHHTRLVICKKAATSITLEPLAKDASDQRIGHDKRATYVRTTDTDTNGRAIFRQGAA